jgi:hypothetical protein
MDQQATRTRPRSYTEDYNVNLLVSSRRTSAAMVTEVETAPDVAVPLGAAVWRCSC